MPAWLHLQSNYPHAAAPRITEISRVFPLSPQNQTFSLPFFVANLRLRDPLWHYRDTCTDTTESCLQRVRADRRARFPWGVILSHREHDTTLPHRNILESPLKYQPFLETRHAQLYSTNAHSRLQSSGTQQIRPQLRWVHKGVWSSSFFKSNDNLNTIQFWSSII